MKRIDHRILLAAVTLGGFALRVIRLDFQPLWWDEGYSLFFATRSFPEMLTRTAVDIHPPLYYALLQIWMAFAGKGEIAVRLLSVAIGVATIPLVYILTLKLFVSRRVALLAAFLLALSPLHIYYSQEVRMYGLVTLLGLASVYLFVQLLRQQAASSRQQTVVTVAYILTTTAALYTQYYAAFIVAFQVVAFAIVFARHSPLVTRRSLVHWLAAWLAIAALYLPWVIYAGGKLYTYVSSKIAIEKYSPLGPLTFLAQHLAAFSIGHVTAWTWLAWGGIVSITLALIGIVSVKRAGDKKTRRSQERFPLSLSPTLLISLYLFIPLALGYLVNLIYPFHPIRNERLLLLAAPAFLMLVALGIDVLWNRSAPFATTAVLVIVALAGASLDDFYTVPRSPNDDYRPLIAAMQTSAQPGDIFLAIYPWQIGYLKSYYHGAPLTIVETPNDEWTNQPLRLQNDLSALLEKTPRVWIPGLQTLGHILEDVLDAHFRGTDYLVLDTWFGTTRLELFQRAADPPIRLQPLSFENGVELPNWGMSSDSVVSGRDIVRVTYWGQTAPTDMRTSMRLVDAKGNEWAQDDREIENRIQKIGFAIPAGTPPGAYALRVALYRSNETATAALTAGTINVVSNDNPNLAAISHRTEIDFAGGMRLVGYDAGDEPLKPGFGSGVTLFWQAVQKQSADYMAEIQLQDAFGKIYFDASDDIAHGIYGSSRWRDNELVRDPRTFTVPGDVPDGAYWLAVALVDPATHARIGKPVRLMQVQVKGRPHYYGAPAPSQKLDARFGEVGKLVGYDSVRSGQNLRIVLYWQALGRAPISYKVFAHVVDPNGKIIAQRDQIPGAGEFPTTTWVEGEYLVDVYDIALANGVSDYRIEIGLYDPGSGARLIAYDALGNPVGDSVVVK
ncbi:MAG: glycosyltransferase family 39 protein [Chloroflexota bacterium]|nr:glycosyltransferase family 39 protein [Chloroflexota bacterium]